MNGYLQRSSMDHRHPRALPPRLGTSKDEKHPKRLEELAVPGYCMQRAENVCIEGSRNPSNLQHQEGAAPFATITATPTREGGGFAEK